MLENRSFDNMLGLANVPGVPSPAGNTNTYQNVAYPVTKPAPTVLTTDPGHELPDALQQLANIAPDSWSPPLGPYPRNRFPRDFANGTGFVDNYVNNTDEGNPAPPTSDHYGDTLKCFGAGTMISQLATEFTVCTNWFSSLPGPTWPNRFFAHFASSNGMDCSPTQAQIRGWATSGFSAPHGSIFKALSDKGLSYRIYNDCEKYGFNSCFSDDPSKSGGAGGGGWVPQVASLQGIWPDSWYELKDYFASDLQNGYSYQYTFIEPHYGDLYSNTYQGGSSQHPMDDIYGGNALIKFVYETLRRSPVWNESLLIVTYDEHGGFYDSVPPPPGIPPGDGSPGYGQPNTLNTFGFQFDQLGVRVPAVLVSPWVPKNFVDTTVYDHGSIPATLEKLFGLQPLTDRDRNANPVVHELILPEARQDCPLTLDLPEPLPQEQKPATTAAERALLDQRPLPESGNLIGVMGILLKMHYELSLKNCITRFFIRLHFRRIKTHGDLRAYSMRIHKKRQAKLAKVRK
jgi:phospholipase C